MYRTLLPLSIAWFDGRGAFVSGTDMDPCTDKDPKRCPVYPAARPYRLALETTQGGLGRLGVDADATLTVPGGACP
jgi:uncharacterized membrane protein (UPF0127 family)